MVRGLNLHRPTIGTPRMLLAPFLSYLVNMSDRDDCGFRHSQSWKLRASGCSAPEEKTMCTGGKLIRNSPGLANVCVDSVPLCPFPTQMCIFQESLILARMIHVCHELSLCNMLSKPQIPSRQQLESQLKM